MFLNDIQNSVQEVANAVAAIMSVDVTIVDPDLIRVAATGVYKDQIGEKLSQGCFYDTLLKSETNDYFIEKKDNEICKSCKEFTTCEELATMGHPIVSKEGDMYGLMGLVAFDDKAHKFMVENYDNITDFLERLGYLLVGNIKYEHTISDLSLKNKEINSLMDSLDMGIIITDENLYISKINTRVLDILNTDSSGLLGRKISDVFENFQEDDDYFTSPISKEFRGQNSNETYVVKTIENIGFNQAKSYIYEIDNYSDVLKDAYNMIETKREVNFDQIHGTSKIMKDTINLSKHVARSDSSVMIRGESGTGKELFARSVHASSSRKDNVFVAINCASIPENLLESELFGYEKGAFTGASQSGKIGKFELAHGGTLFLDEIGDLPIHLQPKLLRVLQDGSFTRIGGNEKIEVDFRLISATNRDLEKMIGDNEFREDLYYRLNVIPINIPALRDRKEDIEVVAKEKLKFYCLRLNKPLKEFSDEVLDAFESYSWPGNIRELENMIEYLVNLTDDEVIQVKHLPEKILKSKVKMDSAGILDVESLEDLTLKELTKRYEKEIIERYLDYYGDTTESKELIAEKLQINLSTLYRKLY